MTEPGQLPASAVEYLFRPPERWGWEYAPPAPVRPFPQLAARPVWVEPAAPVSTLDDVRVAGRRRSMIAWLVVLGVLLAIAACVVGSVHTSTPGDDPAARAKAVLTWGGLGLAVVAVLTGLPFVIALVRRARHRSAWRRWRTGAHDGFLANHQRWAAAHDEHFRIETERVNGAQLWYPVGPATPTSHVDVVGGTIEGWSSLLATMGAAVLGSGSRVLLLDLTGHNITGRLRALCRAGGRSSRLREFPGGLSVADLLADLTAEDVAGTLAEAAAAARRTPDREKYTFDRGIVRQVLARVGGEPRPARLAAAVTTLLGQADPRAALDPAETATLADMAGTIPTGGWEQAELRFLHAVVDELAIGDEPTGARLGDLWLDEHLTVVARISDDRIQRERLDSLLIEAVRRRLATIPVRPGDVIVVAGADQLGPECLDELGRQVRMSGVRLVAMFERLTPVAAGRLGAADNSAVLMRLGHPAEAAHAVRFVGAGTRWPTPARMWPTPHPAGTPDFVLDPAHVQRMPTTAFVAVHPQPGANRRTVFFGDCDPAVAADPRISPQPRPAPAPAA